MTDTELTTNPKFIIGQLVRHRTSNQRFVILKFWTVEKTIWYQVTTFEHLEHRMFQMAEHELESIKKENP